MKDKNLEKFLFELSELTRKYGFYIDACGCGFCSWPWVKKGEECLAVDLHFDDETKEYVCLEEGGVL